MTTTEVIALVSNVVSGGGVASLLAMAWKAASTLASIKERLAVLDKGMDAVQAKLNKLDDEVDEHEARMRVVEASGTVLYEAKN